MKIFGLLVAAAFLIAAPAYSQTNQKPVSAQQQPPAGWSLSDKIALGASVAAFLQFIALLVTIGVMVVNGRRQLRAYLLLEGGTPTDGATEIPPKPEHVNEPGAILNLRNSGQTPAYHILTWAEITVLPPTQEASLAVPPLRDIAPSSLGANSTMSKFITLRRVLTTEEINEIRAGQKFLFIWGRIEYRDAFRRKQWTTFRLKYAGQYPPLRTNSFWFCDKGNDSS